MFLRLVSALTALAVLAVPSTAFAVSADGRGSPNLEHVLNLGYEARHGKTPNYGTDIEFAEIKGRQYALAGSYRNGLQIVDITDPQRATIVAVYDCAVTQGDVQVFTQEDEPGRTFVTYTSDTYGNAESGCYREARAAGFDVDRPPSLTDPSNNGRNGTFIVDVTDPLHPTTVSFVAIAQGSHNQTVHPSGDYMYNSNSDLMNSLLPAIEVIDIRDPSKPKPAGELALPTRPGLGTESHDITFNEEGTRAYSAALSQGVIIDTTKPAEPEVVTSFVDPAINVWHQSDPMTVRGEDGTEREVLIVEDEFVGAVGTGQCPNGGVHVYDVTGDKERSPEKLGYWNIEDLGPTENGVGTCTAHVFDVHEDEQVMTIAWYNGGVRVVDLSGLAGLSIGDERVLGEGMREIAWYRFPDSDTWSAKTPRIERNGDFWLYGNDIERGLDVYRFRADREASDRPGTWEGGPQAGQSSREESAYAGPLDLVCELYTD